MISSKNKSLIYGFLLLLCSAFLFYGCGGGGSNPVLKIPIKTYTDQIATATSTQHATFTLVALPDTQYYVEDYPAILTSQAQWAVDNKTAMNIAFVLHEGDITNTHSTAQFQRASDSLGVMDGKVPYALAVGNHDMGSNRDTTNFNNYFPVSRYNALPTFGGLYEQNKMENCYHYFTAGGTDWMILVLEYDPRDATLAWANQIVDANPARRVIVLTHAYLNGNSRSSIGDDIWNKLVKLHKNISFVLNGHYTDYTAGRLVSVGDNGNKVYQMFADYQTLVLGGTGLLRIIEFDRDKRKVYVKTYSASSRFYKDDDDNQFEFSDVELGPP